MRILSLRVRDKTESEVPCHSQSKEQIDAEPELTTKRPPVNAIKPKPILIQKDSNKDIPRKKTRWSLEFDVVRPSLELPHKRKVHRSLKKNDIIKKHHDDPDSFRPLQDFVHHKDREQLSSEILRIVGKKMRNKLFPDLKKMSHSERHETLCKFIKPMSRKRLLAILDGGDLSESSSTDTESIGSLSEHRFEEEEEKDTRRLTQRTSITNRIRNSKKPKSINLVDIEDGEIVESESESGGSSEIDLPNEGSSPPNIEDTPDSENVTSKCEVFEQKVVCIFPPIYEYADSRDRNIEESDLEEEEIASHSDAERENKRLDNVGDQLNHDLQDELISENAHDNNDLLESLEENIPENEEAAITPAATSSTDDDSKHTPCEEPEPSLSICEDVELDYDC